MVENVKKNLFKKDSLKQLLETYGNSLHLADHLSEDPRDNGEEELF